MIAEFIHNHQIVLLKASLIVAFVEFLIIIALVINIKKKRPQLSDEELAQRKTIKDAKGADINMKDLIDSINKSKALYKQLSSNCHPDRFTAEDIKEKANALIQRITENKNNYAVLQQLKSRAEKELNIKFN
jgi:hypothetical protein